MQLESSAWTTKAENHYRPGRPGPALRTICRCARPLLLPHALFRCLGIGRLKASAGILARNLCRLFELVLPVHLGKGVSASTRWNA